MADALSAKNAEIEALHSSIESLKKQVAASEVKLSSLQVSICYPVLYRTYLDYFFYWISHS